jgi:hypothetical protein
MAGEFSEQVLARTVWFALKLSGTLIRQSTMKVFRELPVIRLGAVALAGWLCATATRADDFQGATHLMPFDEDTIKYSKTKEAGPIAHLQEQIDQGRLKLKHDEKFGYLPGLLSALGVPTNSQMLVFSKTSFQRERIAPKTPRAIFFNDDVYIGFVQGSQLLEISSVDPKLGGVFYTLEQTKVDRPKFVRTDQCLECHASAKTMGVPGHLIRSFATDENGAIDMATGISLVNHRTPIEEPASSRIVAISSARRPSRSTRRIPATSAIART